jgi:hypothetical protein
MGRGYLMLRLLSALSALLIFTSFLLADDYQGIVKSIDKDKNTVTLMIDKEMLTLEFSKDPLVLNDKGKGLQGGIGGVKPGWEVKVFTDKKGDKDIITTLKVVEMKALRLDTYQGIVKNIAKDKSKITLSVNNKNVTLDVDKNAKVLTDKDKALAGGIGGIKTGWEVKAGVDTKGEKDIITSLKVLDMKAKK